MAKQKNTQGRGNVVQIDTPAKHFKEMMIKN